jgi:hypothetical protein
MKWFTMSNLPVTLLVIGLALNGIDVAMDGVLFGSQGKLKGLNDALPQTTIPGTEIPINLGGWLVIVGASWFLGKKYL